MRSNYLALLVPVLTLQLDLISALPTPEDAALVERAASCPADKCFSSIRLQPLVAKVASVFCSNYIKYTPVVTTTSTATATATAVSTTINVLEPPISVVTVSTTPVSPPTTVTSVCSTTTQVAAAFSTSVNYITRASQAGGNNNKRAVTTTIPAALATGCGTGKPLTSKISSACSCFLGTTKTSTVRRTSTITVSTIVTASSTPPAIEITTTVVLPAQQQTVTECQTSTVGPSSRFCGVPVSTYTTSGQITCANTASAPSQTVARFRIEGKDAEGTIFEDCIAASPEDITTNSGGTHRCDGTNNDANPAPGGTMTTAIDAAGDLNGFDFDGSWSDQFEDFFIMRIAGTDSTGNQFWGVLRDFSFTQGGGCQSYNSPGEGLWAFDAFNKNYFLDLSYKYGVVRPGDTVSLTIVDGNDGRRSPVPGALFAGQTSDANGVVTFAAPAMDGCYQYKATRNDAIRSPAFYLSVVSSF